MSSIFSSSDALNKDKCKSSISNQSKSIDFVFHRSDFVDREKDIPNIFITSECINISDSVLEKEKNIPNIFDINSFKLDATYGYNVDEFCKYPNLFTFDDIYPGSCSFKGYLWESNGNYTNLFNLSDVQNNDCAHNIEVSYSNAKKQVEDNLISNDKTSRENVSISVNDLDISAINKNDICSEENSVEKISSAFCFWCVTTAKSVCDHNVKTYFPREEVNSSCIMKDIKLMLINMGTIYFVVDEETHMYKHNGNISITGLTPEMFWSVTKPILKCTNMYKKLCITMSKWKEVCDDIIVKAFIFGVSNILNDYEQTIYAVSNESLLSLVDRLSHITPQLQLLANICCLKTCDSIVIPDRIPCGIQLLNKIHDYLFNYRLPNDLFLKMLIYIFELCCLAYFKILSKWALKGVLDDNENSVFIKLKPDIEDEDISNQKHWNNFIIDENKEIPVFLKKYKNDILNCGKTINFFNKFKDSNMFIPDFHCCFDAIDTQRLYEQFSTYFKYDSYLKHENYVKTMSNCYLFELPSSDHQKENIGSNNIHNENVIKDSKTIISYANDDSYKLFQIPDWSLVDYHIYDFNKPYGFFINNDGPLKYNGQIVDVVNMIEYVPHTILIPAYIQKNVCNKQILDMFFVQENLMGHLYYLSQCFFLMNGTFSSKLCEALFDGIITNRQQPLNIFNPVKLKSVVDEAIQNSFFRNKQHNLTLELTFIPRLNGIIDISDVECVELNYVPQWPINMILSSKILLKYSRIFMFANKLEYVSWSLSKARELLSVYKNNNGLQFRKINLFKYWMNQFITSIQQYYKQVVIDTCWSELNANFGSIQNYDDLFATHKQYMHTMLRQCFMVIGFKDKLILLNKLYMEILAYYQALASGQFYFKNSELLHSEFLSLKQSFSRFVKLREIFYTNLLKTVQTNGKHSVIHLESLLSILGPSYNLT